MRVPKEKIDKVMETCRKLDELGQLRCFNCHRKLRFTHVIFSQPFQLKIFRAET